MFSEENKYILFDIRQLSLFVASSATGFERLIDNERLKLLPASRNVSLLLRVSVRSSVHVELRFNDVLNLSSELL